MNTIPALPIEDVLRADCRSITTARLPQEFETASGTQTASAGELSSVASCLQFYAGMKRLIRGYAPFGSGAALISLLILTSFTGAFGQQLPVVSRPLTKQEKQTIAAFDKRIKLYVKQRAKVKARLPKLSKESTPEQIAANEKALIEGVRAVRTGAKPGDILTRDIAAQIRATLKHEFQGTDRKEIRKIVLEAETAGVPLRVNYPYPDTKEFAEMPATVLLRLPTLPREVKFRYVGRNLFIVDSDNNLIVDYMLDALP